MVLPSKPWIGITFHAIQRQNRAIDLSCTETGQNFFGYPGMEIRGSDYTFITAGSKKTWRKSISGEKGNESWICSYQN